VAIVRMISLTSASNVVFNIYVQSKNNVSLTSQLDHPGTAVGPRQGNNS
jgi:hypothetical protein